MPLMPLVEASLLEREALDGDSVDLGHDRGRTVSVDRKRRLEMRPDARLAAHRSQRGIVQISDFSALCESQETLYNKEACIDIP